MKKLALIVRNYCYQSVEAVLGFDAVRECD